MRDFILVPELPEVTTIVSDLNELVKGKTISDLEGDTPKLIKPLTLGQLKRKIVGLRMLRFERRAKYIIAFLGHEAATPKYALLWHMRMTGHLLFRDEKNESVKAKKYFADSRNQFIRFSISFSDGTRLDFSDVRKFGTLRLLLADKLESSKDIVSLGPDALNTKWTGERICEVICKKKIALKQVLLDQTIIAGIGNIYADEILWTTKINPLLKTQELSIDQCRALAKSIPEVLKKAVKARGTSIDDYRDVTGREGGYGKLRRVYQRKGEKCFRCGTTIARITVNGRGTHFCPSCQRLKVNKLRKQGV